MSQETLGDLEGNAVYIDDREMIGCKSLDMIYWKGDSVYPLTVYNRSSHAFANLLVHVKIRLHGKPVAQIRIDVCVPPELSTSLVLHF